MDVSELRRVLIADDHALFRQGLSLLLQKTVGELDVQEADDANNAFDAVSHDNDFDLILMDLSMPGMALDDEFKGFCEKVSPTPVVILSAYREKDAVTAAINAGARGYMLKSFSESTMRLALELILSGELYVPSSVLDSDHSQEVAGIFSAVSGSVDSPLDVLTQRQRDVLMLMMQGQSNKMIARELGILESTVKAHMQVIFQKLNADNRTHAAMIAREAMQKPSSRIGRIPAG